MFVCFFKKKDLKCINHAFNVFESEWLFKPGVPKLFPVRPHSFSLLRWGAGSVCVTEKVWRSLGCLNAEKYCFTESHTKPNNPFRFFTGKKIQELNNTIYEINNYQINLSGSLTDESQEINNTISCTSVLSSSDNEKQSNTFFPAASGHIHYPRYFQFIWGL